MEHMGFIFLLCISIAYAQLTTTGFNRDTSYDNYEIDYLPSSSPVRSKSQKLTTDSNKKPIFTDCDSYNKAQVKEEQEARTFVIQVKAQDDESSVGGIVTYKIVKRDGGKNYFTIDNRTGEVRTNTPFDRDEPFRQKEIYVTVQATDNGRPPLSDICTFKVTITDINDNSPQLDQLDYNAQVAEDLKVNSEVVRIFAYDIDDGNNSRLSYSFRNNTTDFSKYFRIDPDTGVVYLQESLAGNKNMKFTNYVYVRDNGVEPKSTEAPISIVVVGSDKKQPRVTEITPSGTLELKENFNEYTAHLVTIVAESNINDKEIAFELIKGKTLQTNKEQTFVLTPSSENSYTAYIMLARTLDYETVTEYTLSVRVKNKNLMDTSIDIPIKILDVNDEVPNFIELILGSVVENDETGAQAMVARAIDKDGTSENNIVSYELLSHSDIFSIDRQSGVIKSLKPFDREETSVFHVQVRAFDNSPSALKMTGEPNSVVQTFQIYIEDRNDNAPKFELSVYECKDILENSDIGKDVGVVKAEDRDSASLISYSIVDGNEGDAFSIENSTGRIKVNNKLDYEKIEQYKLRVRAFDGIYEDFAIVLIFIANVNDEIPVFEAHERNIQIEEESIPAGCIIMVKAYDPDIKNKTDNQHILYTVDQDFLKVDADGCVMLTKKLDRDRPSGSPSRQAYINAYDNDGGPNSMDSHSEIMIELEDINDNAPFLNITQVIWYENQDPDQGSLITMLSADDYDGPNNGPPFTFQMAESASQDIIDKFYIEDIYLHAKVMFDREEKKYYDIPILVTDSGNPLLSNVSFLRVIIGDRNDNEAKDGSSEIFVYKYEKWETDVQIGRVFVDDPDDWDLPDKVFVQLDHSDHFRVSNEGMIIMSSRIAEGTYVLHFNVTEENFRLIPRHTVFADVTVTVKDITQEAVVKSGSIRMQGLTIEEFVEKPLNGKSKKDLLHQRISEIVNTSMVNVDVFTVLTTPSNNSLIDVRFSAHGSPYYAPEKLNNKITDNQDKLERELGVEFIMISINECLSEDACGVGNSCSNRLKIDNEEPSVVYTNRTSFVGVKSNAEAVCDCLEKVPPACLNNGVMDENGVCSCTSGYEGPYCEILSIAFNGKGWAMYSGLESCNSTEITLSVAPNSDDGLIFYAGPLTYRHALLSKEFISLELHGGIPVLKIENGIDSMEFSSKDNKGTSQVKSLNDGATHKIRIAFIYSKAEMNVEMEIDDCKSTCLQVQSLAPRLFRINGPLQIGGLSKRFGEESKALWSTVSPTDVGFHGCIKNFTFNNNYYNLGQPSDFYEAFPDCSFAMQQAVTFGIDSNFLVAILVCVAVLLFLLLAVVVHRRQHDSLNEKDIDDTTENIINYEDEGGGECDAHFNLSVFPMTPTKESMQRKEHPDINSAEPDISVFLDTKKDSCDKDPENLPYDDVRHYAYEGDGNSTGSLSSLGSCTDDGDLDFNYLSSFGKRFSKLADMYDYDGSDDDTQNGADEAW